MRVENVAGPSEVSGVDRTLERLTYQPALDGLRGLAVLMVLVYHQGLTADGPVFHGGFLGVDVFFVLSGYLITSLLLAEHASTGRVAIGSFWARRARRLLPAVLVLLLGIALYSATIAKATELAQIRGEAFATLLYVQNWHLAQRFQMGSVLDHTWSLSVEEQWYVVWPLLLAMLLSWKRARPSHLVAVIIGLAAASAAWTYALHQRGFELLHVYYGTDTRAQELLIGAALAVLLRFRSVGARTTRIGVEVIGLVGGVALGAIVVMQRSGSAFFATGGYALFAVAVAAVIAAAVQPASTIIRPVLSAMPLRKLGLISYGLYLYHWPMYFWLSPRRTHTAGTALLMLRLAAAIVAAIVSFLLVERPIRRGALRGLKLQLVTPVAVAVVVAVTLITTR